METDEVIFTKYNSLYYSPSISRLFAKVIDIVIIGLMGYPMKIWELDSYVIIVLMGIMFSYSVICTWLFGTTIGKAIFRLKVVSTVGGRIGFGQALFRELCNFFSFVFIGIGELWSLINNQSRTWHDILCNTIVVVTDKEEHLEERFSKDPWEPQWFISYGRWTIGIISLGLLFTTALDYWVYGIGQWGISSASAIKMEKAFQLFGKYDMDQNGDMELIALQQEDNTESLGVYTIQDFKLSQDEYTIENDGEGIISDLEWVDIDHDGVDELMLSQVLQGEKELILQVDTYRKGEKEFNHIQTMKEVLPSQYQPYSDIELFEDNRGIIHLLWLQNAQRLRVYQQMGTGWEEEYNTFVFNSTLDKGDIMGTGKESIYIIQQVHKDISVDELAYTNGKWEREQKGMISDNLDHIFPLSREVLALEDIDGDGKDEFILKDPMNGVQDRVALQKKESGWCNIYDYEKGQWNKLWVGGNVSPEEKKVFQMSMDLDQDQVKEWIMTDGGDMLYIYKQQPFLFKMNTLLHRLKEVRQKVFHYEILYGRG